MDKFSHKKGMYGHAGKDDAEWQPKSDSNPWQHEASGHGYNARWDDDSGVSRGEQSRGGSQAWESRAADEAAFLSPSQSQTDWDAPHERLSRLIDGQVDQPAGEILGGGGPVSDNKVGGVGPGKVRYKPKTGPQSNDGL